MAPGVVRHPASGVRHPPCFGAFGRVAQSPAGVAQSPGSALRRARDGRRSHRPSGRAGRLSGLRGWPSPGLGAFGSLGDPDRSQTRPGAMYAAVGTTGITGAASPNGVPERGPGVDSLGLLARRRSHPEARSLGVTSRGVTSRHRALWGCLHRASRVWPTLVTTGAAGWDRLVEWVGPGGMLRLLRAWSGHRVTQRGVFGGEMRRTAASSALTRGVGVG